MRHMGRQSIGAQRCKIGGLVLIIPNIGIMNECNRKRLLIYIRFDRSDPMRVLFSIISSIMKSGSILENM
jgi:hypothetical protein